MVNHGGWANVTNAFVSSFWAVYQLGWLAQNGFSVVLTIFLLLVVSLRSCFCRFIGRFYRVGMDR